MKKSLTASLGPICLIADVEQVLDEVIFINGGRITRHTSVDEIREQMGMSVDALFREEFKCF